MEGLIRVGLMALSGVAAGRARRMARESALDVGALLTAGLLAACALGCAATALWLVVARSSGPVGAWLIVAAAFIGLSVAVLVGLWICRATRKRDAIDPPAATELADWLGAHEWPLIAASLLAGFLSGRRRQP